MHPPAREKLFHAGTYRERVDPTRGGSSEDNRIVYQAAQGAKVVIKGSEIIKQWGKVKDGVWKADIPNSFFGGFNPYRDKIGGEWYKTPRDGFDRHTGAVYHRRQHHPRHRHARVDTRTRAGRTQIAGFA